MIDKQTAKQVKGSMKAHWSNFTFSLACCQNTAVERQDLPCTYLAHHELESLFTIIIIITVIIIVIIIFKIVVPQGTGVKDMILHTHFVCTNPF